MSELAFKIGTDPEFFLIEDSTQRIVSAIGKVDGTKDKPLIAPNGAEIHYDNIAFEMALPASKSKEEWLNVASTSLKLAGALLPKGYSLSMNTASALIDSKELEHPDAKVFGCSPDRNAYTLEENETPVCDDNTFRCVGGHIHVGHEALCNLGAQITMARVMDAIHGLISIDLDDSKGSDERRNLYGKAGSYRATEYGIEYRTLSNYWMGSEDLQELMYLLTRDALSIVINKEYKDLFDFFLDEGVDVEAYINSGEDTYTVYMPAFYEFLEDDTVELLTLLQYGGNVSGIDGIGHS